MLNRTSFAITLEEYAEFTVNLNDTFNKLAQHPNIILALEKDEDTQEETKTLVYLENYEEGYIN